jgi:hypothetical protein
MKSIVAALALLTLAAGCAGPSRPYAPTATYSSPAYVVTQPAPTYTYTQPAPTYTYTPTTVVVPNQTVVAPTPTYVVPSTTYVPSASPAYAYMTQAECARIRGVWYPSSGMCQLRP